nr:type I-C CRISPR-associated protein Cas8c/Csd1 [uncultured Tolumonas sp.]
MILKALCDYYHHATQNVDKNIPPYGFEEKSIPFLIVIDKNGHFIQFENTNELHGKKSVPRKFLVAKTIKKSSGVVANLLWDPADYVLGIDAKNKPERTAKQFSAFISTIQSKLFLAKNDEGISAVTKFYAQLTEQPMQTDPNWKTIVENNAVLTFKLSNDTFPTIFNRPRVLAAYNHVLTLNAAKEAFCLVTGMHLPMAVLHPSIKGVWGAQSSGASLVSFNHPSFISWGKEQGANSPISEKAAFEYSTALNVLLHSESPNRCQIGGISVICWSEQYSILEEILPHLLSDQFNDNSDVTLKAVERLFSSLDNRIYNRPDGNTRFFLLGLSPNAARISISFWLVGTVAEFSERLGSWLDDIDIVGREYKGYLSVKEMLQSTALFGKDENIVPNLVCGTIRSIFQGSPMPTSLLDAVLGRIRADKCYVSYRRAGLIKSCLNRKSCFIAEKNKNVTISLNSGEKNIGYRLGRLFAVLEKLETDIIPNLNTTIRDRYYSRACCTPKTVFGTLFRLHIYHLKKSNNQLKKMRTEKMIEEILCGVHELPAYLSQDDQGFFAIGYYHQRQNLFTKIISIKDIHDES